MRVSTTVTEEELFTHTVGTELSVAATFSTGVPLVAKAETTTTLTVNREHQFEKPTSKSETKTSTLPCTALPERYVICHGMVKVQKMSVPYTMTLKNKHYGCTCTSKGVYKSVKHTNIDLEPKTYTSIPSGDQVKDAKLIDDQGQFAEGWSQFVEDQSQLTVN